MDNVVNISEVQPILRQRGDIHHVEEGEGWEKWGLTRIKPINPYTYPPERMEWLWAHVSTQDYAFDDHTRGDYKPFVMGLVDPGSLHFEIGESGYIAVKNLSLEENPDIHFVIWDKTMKIHEILEVGRELITYLFTHSKIARCTALVPTYNDRAKKFSTLLGFKFEGEMRNAVLYNGKRYGVQIFGLLREEFERGWRR